VDLGQLRDYTAIAVLELMEMSGGWDPVRGGYRKGLMLRLRHLERLPLGTPYPEVVQRIRDVVRSADLLGRCRLMVDATGVGTAVVDMLKRADLGCQMMPVMVTERTWRAAAAGITWCRSGILSSDGGDAGDAGAGLAEAA
jgi:hypothetical protein